MSILNKIFSNPPLIFHLHSSNRLIYQFRSFFSSRVSSEYERYQGLVTSSEIDKLARIAENYLPKDSQTQIFNLLGKGQQLISPEILYQLVQEVDKFAQMPLMTWKANPVFPNNRNYFQNEKTFINLPYSKKSKTWSDRRGLQELIRTKFLSLFKENDLIIIPGCADGQIPIEVYAHAQHHQMDVNIIAADYNTTAMKLGYFTMKSYGLNGDKIRWVNTDCTSREFYQKVHSEHQDRKQHHIVTLIQPCLREVELLKFLKDSSELSSQNGYSTTLIMPILLEDPESKWLQSLNKTVAFSTEIHPQYIKNQTRYGSEILKLNSERSSYVPMQYFIKPSALEEIQTITGYSDVSHTIYTNSEQDSPLIDPRRIPSNEDDILSTERLMCIWKTGVN